MISRASRAVLLCGVVYLVAGVALGAIAGRAESVQERTAWRLAAWIISAIAFGAHIVYEQVRIGSSKRTTALHVSLAAAFGAFGLAVAANIHALSLTPPRHSLLLGLSLVIWPVITALPAFVVALIAAYLFDRLIRSR